MTVAKHFASLKLGDKPVEWAILLLAAAGAIYWVNRTLTRDLSDASNAIGNGADAVAEGIGGVISGHNTITSDTDYDGFGIFGTLGAATDAASGSGLSTLGEWFGGKLADVSEYFDQSPNSSSSIQTSANKPFNNGTSQAYQEAANLSPVQAQNTASPWAIGQDGGGW